MTGLLGMNYEHYMKKTMLPATKLLKAFVVGMLCYVSADSRKNLCNMPFEQILVHLLGNNLFVFFQLI